MLIFALEKLRIMIVLGMKERVLREAKDVIDTLVALLPEDEYDLAVGWNVEITGATCSISCLYLIANGLYVNIPKFDFSILSAVKDQ